MYKVSYSRGGTSRLKLCITSCTIPFGYINFTPRYKWSWRLNLHFLPILLVAQRGSPVQKAAMGKWLQTPLGFTIKSTVLCISCRHLILLQLISFAGKIRLITHVILPQWRLELCAMSRTIPCGYYACVHVQVWLAAKTSIFLLFCRWLRETQPLKRGFFFED